MKIVVLAGGLSTERDVSFKTGDMVAKALRENGHQVILLDVFMGYSDKKEDLTGIFDRSEEVSVNSIRNTGNCTGSCKGKSVQKRSVRQFLWTECDRIMPDVRYRFYGTAWRKRRKRARFRPHLICLASAIQEPVI